MAVAALLLAGAAPVLASDVVRLDLGDAGQPIGWANTAGDFDRDGALDVAVARRTEGSRTEISVRLGGQGRHVQRLRLRSFEPIVLEALDVDQDGDADLVADSALTGRRVGVWLNDGRGHLRRSHGHRLSRRARSTHSLDADPAVDGHETLVPVKHCVVFEECRNRRRPATAHARRGPPNGVSSPTFPSNIDLRGPPPATSLSLHT